MKFTPTSFGKMIKSRRKELKLSGKDLAKKVGVSWSYVSKIERLNFIPMPDILSKFATHLKIPESTLFNHALRTKLHDSQLFSILQKDMTNYEIFDLLTNRTHAQDVISSLTSENRKKLYIKELRRCDKLLSNFYNRINNSYQSILYDVLDKP